MKRPLKLKWNRRTAFWLVNAVLALLCAICLVWESQVAGTLSTLDAARTWRGENEMRFVQLACYLPREGLLSENEILSFRSTMSAKIQEASLEGSDERTLYTDAYYGESTISVSTDRARANEVHAFGVSGDFFRFHPLTLRSGNYLSDSDLMKDRVLLDENLAWTLFGGMDLVGMSVTIGEKEYYVAGVVQMEEDKYSSLANDASGGTIFLSYSALEEIEYGSLGIAGYELVSPNPITGFGKGLVEENLSLGKGVLLDNSSRYSVSNLLSVAKDYGKRSMGRSGIIFPYWENALRMTEDLAALALVLAFLFGTLPVVSVLVLGIRKLTKLLKQLKANVTHKVKDDLESARLRRWEKAQQKKED